MSINYPRSIVTDDGWGLIFRGHGLSESTIADGMASEGYVAPFKVSEQHFIYRPRVKNCERYDGWGCDNAGEWHAHWFEVMPSDDEATKFTVVHETPAETTGGAR